MSFDSRKVWSSHKHKQVCIQLQQYELLQVALAALLLPLAPAATAALAPAMLAAAPHILCSCTLLSSRPRVSALWLFTAPSSALGCSTAVTIGPYCTLQPCPRHACCCPPHPLQLHPSLQSPSRQCSLAFYSSQQCPWLQHCCNHWPLLHPATLPPPCLLLPPTSSAAAPCSSTPQCQRPVAFCCPQQCPWPSSHGCVLCLLHCAKCIASKAVRDSARHLYASWHQANTHAHRRPWRPPAAPHAY